MSHHARDITIARSTSRMKDIMTVSKNAVRWAGGVGCVKKGEPGCKKRKEEVHEPIE